MQALHTTSAKAGRAQILLEAFPTRWPKRSQVPNQVSLLWEEIKGNFGGNNKIFITYCRCVRKSWILITCKAPTRPACQTHTIKIQSSGSSKRVDFCSLGSAVLYSSGFLTCGWSTTSDSCQMSRSFALSLLSSDILSWSGIMEIHHYP